MDGFDDYNDEAAGDEVFRRQMRATVKVRKTSNTRYVATMGRAKASPRDRHGDESVGRGEDGTVSGVEAFPPIYLHGSRDKPLRFGFDSFERKTSVGVKSSAQRELRTAVKDQ